MLIAVGLTLLASGSGATAHPEDPLWIRFILGAEDHEIAYVGEIWTFDSTVSRYLLDTFDKNGDGAFDDTELTALEKGIAEQVAPSLLYTRIFSGGTETGDLKVSGFRAMGKDGIVSVAFALAPPQPIAPQKLRVELFDPANFMILTPVAKDPVVFRGALSGTCVPDIALNRPGPDAGIPIPITLRLTCAS